MLEIFIKTNVHYTRIDFRGLIHQGAVQSGDKVRYITVDEYYIGANLDLIEYGVAGDDIDSSCNSIASI